jgi:hypothetical protein
VHVREYGETAGRLCEKALRAGVAVSIVDDCLRLIAVDMRTYADQGNLGVAHVLYHLQLGVKECSLAKDNDEELKKATTIYPFFDLARMNLYAMWRPPMFLWDMPKKLIFDLLFGRVRVFVQLDYGRLFESALHEGIEMRWVNKKELGEFRRTSAIIPGSPGASGIGVKLTDRPELTEQFVLSGFLSRMLLQFMSPSQFLELVQKGFNIGRAVGSGESASS